MAEHKREEIKIGAKLFLNSHDVAHVATAIDHLLATLQITTLDNLILAFHPKSVTAATNGTSSTTNGHHDDDDDGENGVAEAAAAAPKEGVLEWGGGSENAFSELSLLWQHLERYATDGRICQLGIADLDTDSLWQLYKSAVVKPTIAQINLSACCVVPTSLTEFCTKNEIQLLTHSDPEGRWCICRFLYIFLKCFSSAQNYFRLMR